MSAISRIAFVLICLGPLALNACSPAGIAIGAGAAAGTAALEERGFQQSIKDKAREADLSKRLLDYDFDTFNRLNVEVIEGRILLTGIVPEVNDRIRAVQEAWKTPGTVEVINEVLVGSGVGTINTSYDVRITSELRAAVTFDKQVSAVNYHFQAVGGTLHIFGIAQNAPEVERVKAHAREIERVRRIVDHTILKGGEKRREILRKIAELNRQADETASGNAAE